MNVSELWLIIRIAKFSLSPIRFLSLALSLISVVRVGFFCVADSTLHHQPFFSGKVCAVFSVTQ